MENMHLLPTEKPSRLIWYTTGGYHLLKEPIFIDAPLKPSRHIYITSDEEIKEGDWCIEFTPNNEKITELFKCNEEQVLNISTGTDYKYKKIILTTDQDLINDGVQEINDGFLQWFVKNPSCEFVMTIPDVIGLRDVFQPTGKDLYKIIIPKEEDFELVSIGEETIKLAIPMIQDKEDTKQETLKLKRNYEKHSLTKTKGYKLWCNIIQRCYNPKNPSYKYYGEKGVIMEDYFKNSYENFINWIKGIAHYNEWLNSSELSLDRIDNTLGYSRGNIKFSTKTEQVENQNLRVDNKSGYKGVCYHKLNKKYSATITINKSKVFLGYYDTALEAALVYDNYVLKNNLNRKTNL